MKNIRKLLCAILAVALLVLSVAPAFAEIYVNTDPEVYYFGSKTNPGTMSDWIYIGGTTKSTKITDVKSSKKSVVKIRGIEKSKYDYEYYDPDEKSTSYGAEIIVQILKTGTATVSFKVDGKAYKKKYTALAYANPVKSFQLTGFNTKNLKSAFAKTSYADVNMTAKAKAGYAKFTAASGWKLQRIRWVDRSDYSSREYSFGDNGITSGQMPVPAMKKTGSYYVYASFVNTKTKGTMTVYYYLNPASSNRK